jgi:adenylosuccinate lyase
MKVWRGEGVFIDFLAADPDVAAVLTREELIPLFDPTWHFVHVGTIFQRVFGEEAMAPAKAAAE